ncbi:hypothetical protein LF927_09205 [Pectobacterium polaris]|uniref:hypothetical protein n=1 Tax=Pectobacterium polaris TaxID=2042057 RepID=UPI001CF14E6A|nr:hypothetical protein [Pectobacterium polaris]MCA6941361.1 hypothetical protein [Pectobacterium polaris]MCA6956415.1 hypothetical protein [Pectobacterium polaris]
MKETGIIFNGEMVRSIIDGSKTQTRRAVTFKPREKGLNLNFTGLQLGHYCTGVPSSGYVLRSRGGMGCWNDRTHPAKCPYGEVGDRLWVREAFRVMGKATDVARLMYKASERNSFTESTRTVPVDVCTKQSSQKWTPSIHMPRWASRILLEITDVRVERLNSISESDALAEGFTSTVQLTESGDDYTGSYPSEKFSNTWQSIYGRESWDANPWVWVIVFKHIKGD